ncbi:Gfo/Idh/MocA family protein [Aquimarina sp. 2-A2]|uniref:Gfo/Idh/MocA family protein n=1 Tax=Aquimarina sp. 2-A2 TaxID=3382644 RepID=UPI00387EF731
MKSSKSLRIGIVGTGMISNIIAQAINISKNAKIASVSSRSIENAESFAKNHTIERTFSDWNTMLQWDGIDAVYIGVPTIAKEDIAIMAAKNGKHILADKPFLNFESLKRITNASRNNNVVFMDATHFVHHPRTQNIKAKLSEQIGSPQAVRTSFFFPFLDRTNIRYNTDLEPTGAIGDMAWYSARAIVEYMPNAKKIKDIKSFVQRDPKTNAIFRGAGVIIFEDESTSNWDIGYNAGVCIMDLDILGTDGQISIDDFVLDWAKGFAFNDESHKVGYTLRKGMATPKEFKFIETHSQKAQTTLMIENFTQLLDENNKEVIENTRIKSEQTQQLLDAIWNSIE